MYDLRKERIDGVLSHLVLLKNGDIVERWPYKHSDKNSRQVAVGWAMGVWASVNRINPDMMPQNEDWLFTAESLLLESPNSLSLESPKGFWVTFKMGKNIYDDFISDQQLVEELPPHNIDGSKLFINMECNNSVTVFWFGPYDEKTKKVIVQENWTELTGEDIARAAKIAYAISEQV